LVKLKVVDLMHSEDEFFHSVYDGYIDYGRFEVVRAGKGRSEEDICRLVEDAVILLSDPLHIVKVTKKIIEAGKKLRLIQCHTVGYDDIDIKAARGRGIPVANSAGVNSNTIAEYVIMAALYLLKPIRYAHSELKEGRWAQEEIATQPNLTPQELAAKTLGIIGCGNIGQEVARHARTFGTRVLYHNRNRLPEKIEQRLGIEYSSLDGILRSSDILSINLPLTDQTRGMIGAEEIAKMKPGAILINTARGGIVDESALAEALKHGRLKGAAFDVFEDEPNIRDCPMLEMENVLLTPHISGVSPEVIKRVPPKVVENLNRIYKGEPPLRVVN
jgi:phosphoglycerate dehydrogenase-like enzyme